MTTWSNGFEFENEVRRIARALWGSLDGNGAATMAIGRERDCIFETPDVVHYIECTRKRSLDKVREDSWKMTNYRDLRHKKEGRLVKLWIVTEHEPTADQRTEAQKNLIEILSLAQFERKLLDADGYLELRRNYRFGSATDPDTDSHDLSNAKYQPTVIRDENNKRALTVKSLADCLSKGDHAVLFGDYGMGNSITFRELFLELRNRRVKGTIRQTPVLLNLRDHWGQRSPSEALVRHAGELGFAKSEQLIRALHAGNLIIMLDGFDESASIQWTPRTSSRMREARRSAVSLVKAFAEAQRGKGGFIVAGRDHFFDSRAEADIALGIRNADLHLSLDGFSVAEMKAFLRSRGLNQRDLPDWLPNRPLLLAYLSVNNLLGAVLAGTDKVDPAEAWEIILDRICSREASIHEYLGADSIRQILEHVASRARTTSSGMGPITEQDILDSFQRVTNFDADEAARPLLMRLPGLSVRDQIEGRRSFLDDQMLDVLRAGDVLRFTHDPYVDPEASEWKVCMSPLGNEVVARRLQADGLGRVSGRAISAAQSAVQRWSSNTLALDLFQVARTCNEDSSLNFNDLAITNSTLPVLDLSEGPIPTRLTLDNIFISDFHAPYEEPTTLRLKNCVFERVFGYSSRQAFPAWIEGCDAECFDDAATNAAILRNQDLALGVRVALTMLRKLFLQRGHGRKESALLRGMTQAAKLKAPLILPLLLAEGLAFPSTGGSWHPVQGQRSRVYTILENPNGSRDPFIQAAKKQ